MCRAKSKESLQRWLAHLASGEVNNLSDHEVDLLTKLLERFRSYEDCLLDKGFDLGGFFPFLSFSKEGFDKFRGSSACVLGNPGN